MAASRIRLAGLHREVRARAEWALSIADRFGVPVQVTSGFRSWENQARLRRNFEQCVAAGKFGNTPDCMFPANRAGDSSHNWGYAWDSTVPPEFLDWWTMVRQAAGFEVLPNDIIHAQVPNWRNFT